MQQLKHDEQTVEHLQGSRASRIKERTRTSASSGQRYHGLIFSFGVVLPIIAVLFETTFHFCARHFFDPFPSTNHVILFLLIPLSNYLTLLASRRNLSAHYSFITLASGMALGMGAMYSLMFLPLLGASLYFVGAFGFGLLGLAPALSLPCSWLAGKRACKLSAERKTYFNPHQLEHIGHLIILVMVLAVELPSTLTRVYLGLAAAPATETEGIRWLRKYGSEEVMLRACYERSGRATDIIGSLYESGHPLPVTDARAIFYRVTGKPFNSVPIPAAARATIQHALAYDPGGLNAKVEDEFDLDTDIAGQAVSGVARGLSVSAVNASGKVDADAMLSEFDWSFGLSNVSKYDREARCKILLPPGAVASRATLTINNKEHEATIMVREAAREYYRQSVYQHKDDPLLVSTSGADQVLVQCYPVHPDSNMKVKLHVICPLSFDKDLNGALILPAFAEKNFQVNVPTNVSLESEKPLAITGLSSVIKSCPATGNAGEQPPASGSKAKWQLTAKISADETARFEAFMHGERNHDCHSVFCRDTFKPVPVPLLRMISESHYQVPQKLLVLLDGSVAMKAQLPEIIKGLAALPPGISTKIVLIADEERTVLSGWKKPGSTEYQKAIKSLETFIPAGGQDNSSALVKFAKEMAADSAGLLWIHAAQPVSVSGCERDIKNILRDWQSQVKNPGATATSTVLVPGTAGPANTGVAGPANEPLPVSAMGPVTGVGISDLAQHGEKRRAPGGSSASRPGQPLIYDLLIAAGPVEILSTIDNCSGIKRIERTSSISDDLSQLYKSWQPQRPSDSPEFVNQPDLDASGKPPGMPQTSSSLAQLMAYNRILSDLELTNNHGTSGNRLNLPDQVAANEPYTLARQYHLISPVSSAVVTDTVAELTPLPRPKPDQLNEFFSSKTVENTFRQISQAMNNLLEGNSANISAMLDRLNPLNALTSAISQSFSTTVSQLNKLNSVTLCEPSPGPIYNRSTGSESNISAYPPEPGRLSSGFRSAPICATPEERPRKLIDKGPSCGGGQGESTEPPSALGRGGTGGDYAIGVNTAGSVRTKAKADSSVLDAGYATRIMKEQLDKVSDMRSLPAAMPAMKSEVANSLNSQLIAQERAKDLVSESSVRERAEFQSLKMPSAKPMSCEHLPAVSPSPVSATSGAAETAGGPAYSGSASDGQISNGPIAGGSIAGKKRVNNPMAVTRDVDMPGPVCSITPAVKGQSVTDSEQKTFPVLAFNKRVSRHAAHPMKPEYKKSANESIVLSNDGTARRSMGNIAPYRKHMLQLIAANWHPRSPIDVTVQFQISKDGQILAEEIVNSSGNQSIDKQALSAIKNTVFDPLPGWYKGQSLTFKINLGSPSMCAADELEKAKAEVLRQIAEHWQPKWKSGHVSILLKIDTNGKVFTALVCKTSGNKLLDDQALSVINGIQFQQLPEWLNLKVDLYCSRQPGLKMISTAQNSSSADGIVFIRWLDSAPLEAEQTQQSPVSGQDQQTMATRVAQRSLAIEEAKRRRQVAEQQRWRQATEQEQRSSAGRTYHNEPVNKNEPPVALMICSLIASAIIALVLIQRSRKLNRNTIALSAGIFIGLPVAVYYIATLQVDVAALSPVAGMMDISSRPDKWLWIIDFVIFLGLLVALLRSRYSRP